jgi:hypothetical protein
MKAKAKTIEELEAEMAAAEAALEATGIAFIEAKALGKATTMIEAEAREAERAIVRVGRKLHRKRKKLTV